MCATNALLIAKCNPFVPSGTPLIAFISSPSCLAFTFLSLMTYFAERNCFGEAADGEEETGGQAEA